jgi:hypothetical protein
MEDGNRVWDKEGLVRNSMYIATFPGFLHQAKAQANLDHRCDLHKSVVFSILLLILRADLCTPTFHTIPVSITTTATCLDGASRTLPEFLSRSTACNQGTSRFPQYPTVRSMRPTTRADLTCTRYRQFGYACAASAIVHAWTTVVTSNESISIV